MKTTQHTPGPWEFDPAIDTFNIGTISVGPDPENYPVAHVESWTDGGTDCDEAKTALANARLIAAAPELLAALELIYANAAESPEWIRASIAPAILKATRSASCTCESECSGPVPPYCSEHDGDYSAFLAFNNCD